MARLRYNGLRTTLAATLSTSATGITFAAALTHSGGTAVPTLSGGDYIPLALINPATGNLKEIVRLTAYTTGATTGTITRAQEGTSGVTHALNEIIVAPLLNAELAAIDTALAGKQPSDTDLTSIAALSTTSYGRAFLELANQAALMALVPAASDTVPGKVELATDAEAIAGTDTTRAVTPHALEATLAAQGQVEATDALPGIVELATRAEAAARADTTRAVTPDGLDAALDAVEATIPAATPDASTTVKGKVELATTAETQTGTDAVRAVTPAAAAATYQPVDSDLTAIAALTTQTYGRALLTLANLAALQVVIGGTDTTTPGLVELATDAETITGTDAFRAVTPHGLTAAMAAAMPGVRVFQYTYKGDTSSVYPPGGGEMVLSDDTVGFYINETDLNGSRAADITALVAAGSGVAILVDSAQQQQIVPFSAFTDSGGGVRYTGGEWNLPVNLSMFTLDDTVTILFIPTP